MLSNSKSSQKRQASSSVDLAVDRDRTPKSNNNYNLRLGLPPKQGGHLLHFADPAIGWQPPSIQRVIIADWAGYTQEDLVRDLSVEVERPGDHPIVINFRNGELWLQTDTAANLHILLTAALTELGVEIRTPMTTLEALEVAGAA